MIATENCGRAALFAKVPRVYCVCFFPTGAVVPEVKLVKAANDGDVIQQTKTKYPSGDLEIWDDHRLVANFRADSAESFQLAQAN